MKKIRILLLLSYKKINQAYLPEKIYEKIDKFLEKQKYSKNTNFDYYIKN